MLVRSSAELRARDELVGLGAVAVVALLVVIVVILVLPVGFVALVLVALVFAVVAGFGYVRSLGGRRSRRRGSRMPPEVTVGVAGVGAGTSASGAAGAELLDARGCARSGRRTAS